MCKDFEERRPNSFQTLVATDQQRMLNIANVFTYRRHSLHHQLSVGRIVVKETYNDITDEITQPKRSATRYSAFEPLHEILTGPKSRMRVPQLLTQKQDFYLVVVFDSSELREKCDHPSLLSHQDPIHATIFFTIGYTETFPLFVCCDELLCLRGKNMTWALTPKTPTITGTKRVISHITFTLNADLDVPDGRTLGIRGVYVYWGRVLAQRMFWSDTEVFTVGHNATLHAADNGIHDEMPCKTETDVYGEYFISIPYQNI